MTNSFSPLSALPSIIGGALLFSACAVWPSPEPGETHWVSRPAREPALVAQGECATAPVVVQLQDQALIREACASQVELWRRQIGVDDEAVSIGVCHPPCYDEVEPDAVYVYTTRVGDSDPSPPTYFGLTSP